VCVLLKLLLSHSGIFICDVRSNKSQSCTPLIIFFPGSEPFLLYAVLPHHTGIVPHQPQEFEQAVLHVVFGKAPGTGMELCSQPNHSPGSVSKDLLRRANTSFDLVNDSASTPLRRAVSSETGELAAYLQGIREKAAAPGASTSMPDAALMRALVDRIAVQETMDIDLMYTAESLDHLRVCDGCGSHTYYAVLRGSKHPKERREAFERGLQLCVGCHQRRYCSPGKEAHWRSTFLVCDSIAKHVNGGFLALWGCLAPSPA